ncbi:hypothetical protein SCHPADRAFT_632524 [Schizopora paradoxa]|uniref:Uncharacterized protein n=1 Tax=Schizopora paradoxa TaxID=27342 RepID=A0A0H2R8U4_9AGAM|nr:hypothetical protein SCHPADRAFT_632524 [Schizopora paradoxa]
MTLTTTEWDISRPFVHEIRTPGYSNDALDSYRLEAHTTRPPFPMNGALGSTRAMCREACRECACENWAGEPEWLARNGGNINGWMSVSSRSRPRRASIERRRPVERVDTDKMTTQRRVEGEASVQ